MSFLQDPVWISIFISSLSVIVPLITAIIIYRKSLKRKGLSYEVISNVPLLNNATDFQGSIQILLNGKPLNNANIVVIKILNSGNIPILPTDFTEPFTFNFGTGSTVIDTEILEVIPSTINASVTTGSECLTLVPLLLNSKDSIKLKVLLTDFNGEISVHARIVDIKQVQRFDRGRQRPHIAVFSTMIASCTMAVIIALIAALKLGLESILIALAVAIPLFLGIVIIFILYLLSRRR